MRRMQEQKIHNKETMCKDTSYMLISNRYMYCIYKEELEGRYLRRSAHTHHGKVHFPL